MSDADRAEQPEPPPQLQRTVLLTGVDLAQFLGHRDQLIADLERHHPEVEFHARDHVLTLSGPATEVRAAEQVVSEVLEVARRSGAVSRHDVREVGRMVQRGSGPSAAQVLSEPIVTVRGHAIRPQTQGQRSYVDGIEQHTITFGIGPAGTGKTYLAVACAVDALERNAVQRIVLTRPAVEAGERLGFLPGDLTQKVDPYLRPLYDALYELMGFDRVQKAFERNALEIAPLAFMRGRTLNNAFVILDEAQNTTPEQMKMFLTRIGFGARAVVTGDVSQIDLPKGSLSGLIDAERVLKRVKGIAVTRFTSADVVRHPLVARIVDAYDAQRSRRGTGE